MKVLALGGARSGKSGWAERTAASLGSPSPAASNGRPVHYIATARPWPGSDGFDEDFADRVRAHRERRPSSWVTVDDLDAPEALRSLAADGAGAPPVLLDDVGTYLTHVLDRGNLWESPRGSSSAVLEDFVDAVRDYPGPLVLVSPEVGMGVIPEHRSGRLFRDELGVLNASLAQGCDHVVLVVAGLPLPFKGGLPSTA